MIAAALAAVSLAASVSPMPFAEAPPVEVWVTEDWPADALASASRLPRATLGLAMRSNMIRPEAAAALGKRDAALVRIVPKLEAVHVDALRKLPRATVVVPLAGPLDTALAGQLSKLGPQPLRIVVKRLDAATAKSLGGLPNAEVELDARGRFPDQEELGLFLGVRARRVVRIRASDAPPLAGALKLLKPVRLVVDSPEGRVPEGMTNALVEAGLPVRVAIDTTATPDDLKRLAVLPQVSLELGLSGDPEVVVPRARALLEAAGVAR